MDNSNYTAEGVIAVLDTSSMLVNGVGLLNSLSQCAVVVPAFVVNELKKMSTGKLGSLAKQWLTLMDGLDLKDGSTIPGFDDLSLHIVGSHHSKDSSLELVNIARQVTGREDFSKYSKVVVVSNEPANRVLVKVEGIEAVEYYFEKPRRIYDGRYLFRLSPEKYSEFCSLSDEEKKTYVNNELNLCETPGRTVVQVVPDNLNLVNGDRFDSYLVSQGSVVKHISQSRGSDWHTYGIKASNIEQYVALSYLRESPQDLPLVSCHGVAGSGKTLLALSAGLEGVFNTDQNKHKYESVMVFRSLHEMGEGQEMGFLPGNVDEKMIPYSTAIHDALKVIARGKAGKKNASESKVEAVFNRLLQVVDVQPITYLRGRSISNTYIIIDEAQNLSALELLNVLSRVGDGSKVVLTFDDTQVDSKFLKMGKDAEIWSVISRLSQEDGIIGHISLYESQRSLLAEVSAGILEDILGKD